MRKSFQGSSLFFCVAYAEHWGDDAEAQKKICNYLDFLFGPIPVAVSPLHDKDVFEDDVEPSENYAGHKKGDLKKPHFHFILKFDKQRSINKIRSLLPNCKVEVAMSLVGCVRYLCHLDDKDKVLYEENDVYTSHDFAYQEYKERGKSDEDKLNILIAVILNNNISDMKTLLAFLYKSENFNYLLHYVAKKTYFVREFLNSGVVQQENDDLNEKVPF